jgi:hypothetical protein
VFMVEPVTFVCICIVLSSGSGVDA